MIHLSIHLLIIKKKEVRNAESKKDKNKRKEERNEFYCLLSQEVKKKNYSM